MSQSDDSCAVPGQLPRITSAANELADGNENGYGLLTAREDARTMQPGSSGRYRLSMVASLSGLPVASQHGVCSHLSPRNDANADLCETRQTQELGDDFFALYTSQAEAASPSDCHGGCGVTVSGAGISARTTESNNCAEPVPLSDLEDEGADPDNDVGVESEVRVGRTDGHHAQRSHYMPVTTEDLEEEDVIADSAESAAIAAAPAPDQSTDGLKGEAQPSLGHTCTTSPTCRQCSPEYWPHPHPPPPRSALSHPRQTRVAFHTQRYGAFIKAYLGLSDVEVEQAQRRGRGICMIGVRKAPPSSSHVASSASYATPYSPTSAAAAGNVHLPTFHRHSHHGFGEPVKLQRAFLRHSVLAVEGDAVFSELIDRAEVLYAVEQQRLDAAWKAYAHKAGVAEESVVEAVAPTAAPGAPAQRPLYPQFRKLPRVTEPYLRPNARCIALHYGLPDRETPANGEGSAGIASLQRDGNPNAERRAHAHCTLGESPSVNPYPRASLMAVVCTTRVEEGEEIYVSLESYYRCLDETAWYRRCYSELNKRCGCPDGAAEPRMAVADPAKDDDGTIVGTACQSDLIGDVYTGVKRFLQWPTDLAFYHGVGRRHASNVAEAAFPFTLVDLGPAPELGDNQKGVVASAWLPYATCLLYCGPSVATRKVERLVTERALRGSCATDTSTISTAKDEAQTHEEGNEEDLSFVTDDTYALGLGRHGVCFGQGLTRYINHRYNTSRFGNVELCSVILSVPSEFGTAQRTTKTTTTTTTTATTTTANAAGTEKLRGAGEALAAKSGGASGAPSLTAEERARVVRAVVAKRSRHRGGARRARKETTATVTEVNAAVAVPAPGVEGGSAALSAKPKRRPPRRRAPCLFLEERSFFVTVPFFLVTTDIPPGTPLLAWSYGEDYDAKLERQAVAEGHLVPYADAVLLNKRLAAAATTSTSPTSAAGCRLQRYNGDYRFAVGVGDVVWRRRPLRRLGLPLSFTDFTCGYDVVDDAYVPPPEDDLFVVVQTLRSSVERVLLRPLQRIPLTSRQLGALLREQHRDDYVSPHAPSRTQPSLQEKRRRSGRPPSAKTKRRQKAAFADDLAAHWAVFRLTDIGALAPAPFAATSFCLTPQALSRYEEALRTCVVATTDSVGLLLMDIDYSAVYSAPNSSGEWSDTGAARSITCSPQECATRSAPGGRRGTTATPMIGRGVETETHRMILVNLDDLRYATSLVRTSPERGAAVPALCNGLLWPLYCL
ncbi:hypothetical protein JKF63_07288 [Porcisia hertigi]|uniref:SET domain-containing protein n=1 Tax=Porcisia hertigi TaxID=2761500 RepID=A0A836LLB6_9TRYP|nr:hypothetical protein JKF63_07288 [Porcisia hertigi]